MLFCKLFLLFISKTDFTFVKYTLNGINKDYFKKKIKKNVCVFENGQLKILGRLQPPPPPASYAYKRSCIYVDQANCPP